MKDGQAHVLGTLYVEPVSHRHVSSSRVEKEACSPQVERIRMENLNTVHVQTIRVHHPQRLHTVQKERPS
jgi:hypothetical protein